MAKKIDGIAVDCIVHEVKTLTDGGLRVVLDMPEDAIEQAKWLMSAKRGELVLRVAMAVMPDETG